MRLPPLPPLRTFVAVAETGSVTRAAERLHLTHGAVSHQMRQLQQSLDVTLFERDGRGLRLTPAGATYAARVARAMTDLADATRQLQASQSPARLRISVMPSFAARWLLPRLGDFIARHPDADVQVQSTSQLADIAGGEADVGLRFGRGRYVGLDSVLLMPDWYYPVCTPAYAAAHGLDSPARLTTAVLLRSADESWRPWFACAGLDLPEPQRGVMFDDSSLMLVAAGEGKGVALARHSLVIEDLAAGRLVRPFVPLLPSPSQYFLATRPADAQAPMVRAFCDWIMAAAASYPVP